MAVPVTRTRRAKGVLTLVTALATLFALVGPLGGIASAVHGARTLEVTPETATNAANGTTTHVLTATLSAAPTVDAVPIDFEVESGPADPDAGNTPTTPDFTCTVAVAATTCTVTIGPTTTAGTTTVRAWIDHDGLNSTVEADATEGATEATTPGADAEPDITDVVTKTWTSVIPQACVDAEPNTDSNISGTEHIITARVTDAGALAADANNTFDCTGNPLVGVSVTITLTDDVPNIFVSSTNGTSTGGPVAGGPNTATATTNAQGEVTFGIRLVNPADQGTNDTITIAVPTATVGDPDTDTVAKTWGAAGVPAALDATPQQDTNEVNTSHTVTASVTDAAGNPVAGVNVDFQVTAGEHDELNLDGVAATPAGYFGQCTTAADGTCTASYTGTQTAEGGLDTITVWIDANFNDTLDGAEISLTVSKQWVAAGLGTRVVRLDMEPTTAPDVTLPIVEATWEATAAANTIGANHEIVAEAFSQFGAQITTSITFTITSGPGFFTTGAATTNNLGTSITLPESGDGLVHAFLRSTVAGNTVVEARANGATDTGTKPWVAGNAFTVDAEPEEASNSVGTNHLVTATVKDASGNPVSGVTVTFTLGGVGLFSDGTAGQKQIVTGADGQAIVTTTSSSEGTQTVTASISAATTDCELAGGICSDSVTKTWVLACPGFEDDPRNQVVGTPADDVLVGTAEDDIICGLGGDDLIDGLGGADILLGGAGSDVIRGRGGNDTIRGGGGRDTLSGNTGNDTIRGGRGNDVVIGGFGNDLLLGGDGADILRGNRGRDRLLGGRNNDRLFGNAGNDFLDGGPGTDSADGGLGTDTCTRVETRIRCER